VPQQQRYPGVYQYFQSTGNYYRTRRRKQEEKTEDIDTDKGEVDKAPNFQGEDQITQFSKSNLTKEHILYH
jgi:hypothetical protein